MWRPPLTMHAADRRPCTGEANGAMLPGKPGRELASVALAACCELGRKRALIFFGRKARVDVRWGTGKVTSVLLRANTTIEEVSQRTAECRRKDLATAKGAALERAHRAGHRSGQEAHALRCPRTPLRLHPRRFAAARRAMLAASWRPARHRCGRHQVAVGRSISGRCDHHPGVYK